MSKARRRRKRDPRRPEGLLTVREIAVKCSVQPGQVRRWIEDGCPVAVKGGPGKSALLREDAVKTWRAEHGGNAGISVAAESANLKRIQAQHEELRVKKLRGETMDAKEVDGLLADVTLAIKPKLLALPRALAERLVAAAAAGPANVERVLRDGIHDALTELASLKAPGTATA